MTPQKMSHAGSAPAPLPQRGMTQNTLDELLRNTLRIADARDPEQLMRALQALYPDETQRLTQEVQGTLISFAQTGRTGSAADAPSGDTMSDRAYAQARRYMEQDLAALVTAPANREIRPEMVGWQEALAREVADGAAAARRAQDPTQRERALLTVRKLQDFARLSRMYSVAGSEDTLWSFRRLATSLDRSRDVLLVLMGQSLEEAGLGDAGMLLQVPVSDLRQRSEAVLAAVRRLNGLGDDNDAGAGIASRGALLAALDSQSSSELASYLDETMLSLALGKLVNAISLADPASIKGLAATAPVELSRLKRLRSIASGLMLQRSAGVSNALSGFVQALNLFLDGFAPSQSGTRLTSLGSPVMLSATDARRADGSLRRLLCDLVSLRAEFAREIESYLSSSNAIAFEFVVQLDALLYWIDRAVLLLAMGTGSVKAPGDEEKWAAVIGQILLCIQEQKEEPSVPASLLSDDKKIAAKSRHETGQCLSLTAMQKRLEESQRNLLDWIASKLTGDQEISVKLSEAEPVLNDLMNIEGDWLRAVRAQTVTTEARAKAVGSAQELLEDIQTCCFHGTKMTATQSIAGPIRDESLILEDIHLALTERNIIEARGNHLKPQMISVIEFMTQIQAQATKPSNLQNLLDKVKNRIPDDLLNKIQASISSSQTDWAKQAKEIIEYCREQLFDKIPLL